MAARILKGGVRQTRIPEGRQYLEGSSPYIYVALPKLEIAFTADNNSLNVVLPKIALSGFVISNNAIEAVLPKIQTAFECKAGGVFALDAILPSIVPSFTTQKDNTLAVLLPAFDVAFTLQPYADFSLDVNLPQQIAQFFAVIDSASIASNADYVVWVNNPKTGSHANYENWNANSYAKFNGVDIIALPDGLYSVGGSLDGSANINAKVYWVTSDLGTQKQKRIDSLSVNMRNLDQAKIRIMATCDEQQVRGYEKTVTGRPEGIRRHRHLMPKGLNGQNWQFGFENVDGGDFTLDEIAVVSVDLNRTFK